MAVVSIETSGNVSLDYFKTPNSFQRLNAGSGLLVSSHLSTRQTLF